MSPVRLEKSDGVLSIVLDSPANRNALSPDLVAGIREGLRRADEDADIRSIVLTHTGTTFCAGADLSAKAREGSGGGAGEAREGSECVAGAQSGAPAQSPLNAQQEAGRQMVALLKDMLSTRVPVVGLIDGHTRAGGMGLVAACDYVVAGPNATFGLSEVRIGVVAAIVSSVICERVGDRTAAEWFLTGRKVNGVEAQAAGFVTAVSEDPRAAVAELNRTFLLGAPAAVSGTKELLNRRIIARLEDEAEDMLELSAQYFLSEEAQAGMQAFRAKEQPPWARD